MGSRWPINGHGSRAIDPSGQSSVVNVPNASSSSATPTSNGPNISYFPSSAFSRPSNFVQSATTQSRLLNPVTVSSVASQASHFRAQPSVQKPQTAPQPQPQPQPYSHHQAQAQAPAAVYGSSFQGPLYASGGAQDFSSYRLPPESSVSQDLFLATTKIIESQCQKTTEALLPHFTSLHADVNLLKASFGQVTEDVSKIRGDVTKTRDDIQTIFEAQKRSDAVTGKALRDFADRAEALKAFLGETRLSYEKGGERTTMMGRLDDMYSALCEVIEKMTDHEANLPEDNSIESINATPVPGHRTQAPTPSTDVDMADTEHPASSSSIQMTEENFNATSNDTSALNLSGATNSGSDGMDLERVGGSVPPIPSDLLEGVSKPNRTQGGEERSPTPIHPPPPETTASAKNRIDIYTRTSPVPPRNLNSIQPDPQGTPQARLPSLAIERSNIPEQQQQPPTPISPVTSTITNMHSLDTSITPIAHSFPLNPFPHSLPDFNAAEENVMSSPPIFEGLLPELGYPTREPTVVPDCDDIDVGSHGDGILDEGAAEDEAKKVNEDRDNGDDEGVGENRSMNIEGEQSAVNEALERGAGLGWTDELEPEPSYELGVGVEKEVEAELGTHEPEESIRDAANEEVEGGEKQDEDLVQSGEEDRVQPGEGSPVQPVGDLSRPGLFSENREAAPISGTADSIVSGDAPTSQDIVERALMPRKSKEPLFLPESRTGTMSPFPAFQHDIGLGDEIKEEEEEETQSAQVENRDKEMEELETSEHLLLPPVIEPSAPATTFPVPFAPPLSPQPQRQPSSEPSEDHASSSPSPSPASSSPVVVRTIPIIDVSQVIPSQLSQPQSSPCLSYADLPIGPEATSTPRASHGVISASPEEASHVVAHLTTLSEPSSSEDEESEDEEEEQVDELSPSEAHPSPPPLPKQPQQQRLRKELTVGEEETECVQETFTTDNTITVESSLQTFTPRQVPLGGVDSIRSFGVVSPSPVRQTARKQTGSKSPRKRGEKGVPPVLGERRDEHIQERHHVEPIAVEPELGSHEEPGCSPPHPPPSPEPAPQITVDSPNTPTPSVQTANPDTRNQNRTQKAMSPIPLPDYISPVNSPSPSCSPMAMHSFRSVFGVSAVGRKRKLEEMRMRDGTKDSSPRNRQRQQQQQASTIVLEPETESQLDDAQMDVVELPLHEREVLVRNTGTMATNGRSGPASPPARTNPSSRPTSTKKKSNASLPLRATELGASTKEGRKQKKQSREESPIYISSSPPSPTEESGNEGTTKDKGKSRDRIDLTRSPSPPRTQPPAVKARNMLSRSGVAPAIGSNLRKSNNANPSVSMVGTKTKAQRERERKEEEQRRETAEREKREAEKKRKREKEKKMLPIGTEDSDDAEIIPIKSYKKPQVVLDEDDSGDCGGGSGSTNVTVARVPRVDLSDILARRKANEKASKARTKVKRKDRTGAPALDSPSVSASTLRSRNDGEPPLKKAKMRSADRGTTMSSGSTENRSSRNQEERSVEREQGKKGSQSRQNPYDPPSSPVRVSWPVKKAGSRFDKNFVECDICKTWYHYGCVGIKMGDIRLQDSESFACPPCHSNRLRGTVSPTKGKVSKEGSKDMDTCGRPDCGFKTIPDEDEYFVKRIIGKRVKHEGGRGRVEEWLVEWEGYPIGESTWEKETSMANPVLLIEGFNEAAEKEGWDLDEDPNVTVLLEDATRAGLSGLT